MVSYKIVIGSKDGKTIQKELAEEQSSILLNKKIGDKVNGDEIGLEGYEFEICGGSDNSGTPMRRDVEGTGKKEVLCVKGIGVHKKRKGQKQRKKVCGNVISEQISQINIKVIKEGKSPLAEKTEEAPEGEAKKEPKAEEKPAEKKEEAKPEEKKE